MAITMSVVVIVISYICGEITKSFIDNIPNRYIPIQNVIIGALCGIMCFFIGLNKNIIFSITLCLISSLSAGGIFDLIKTKTTNRDSKKNKIIKNKF